MKSRFRTYTNTTSLIFVLYSNYKLQITPLRLFQIHTALIPSASPSSSAYILRGVVRLRAGVI